MTKHETAMIRNIVNEAWENLKEAEYNYVKENFAFGYGYTEAHKTEFIIQDGGLKRLLIEWETLDRLTEAFGIEYRSSERANDFRNKTWKWLEGIEEGGAE